MCSVTVRRGARGVEGGSGGGGVGNRWAARRVGAVSKTASVTLQHGDGNDARQSTPWEANGFLYCFASSTYKPRRHRRKNVQQICTPRSKGTKRTATPVWANRWTKVFTSHSATFFTVAKVQVQEKYQMETVLREVHATKQNQRGELF